MFAESEEWLNGATLPIRDLNRFIHRGPASPAIGE
jgi:hypothetical protein